MTNGHGPFNYIVPTHYSVLKWTVREKITYMRYALGHFRVHFGLGGGCKAYDKCNALKCNSKQDTNL